MIAYPVGRSGQMLVFTDPFVETFAKNRQLRFWQGEAGGQSFGRFHGARIKVVEATGTKRTDRRTRRSYIPDRRAEQREIDDRFDRGLHFVGDWHTHPETTPRPSWPDIVSLDDTVRKSAHAMLALVLSSLASNQGPKAFMCLSFAATALPANCSQPKLIDA